MTGKLASLKHVLISQYEELRRRLTYKLGNADMASDALHEAYVRLHAEDGDDPAQAPATAIAHPAAYLYRMAFHIAVDEERRVKRHLTSSEVDEALEIADPLPGPAQIAQGRQDLAHLVRDMEKLPRRCREILLAVRLDGATREELAQRYRISLRTVDRELEKGYAFCVERMRRG